jgi:tetraacyldisaccharide 4'-kinase
MESSLISRAAAGASALWNGAARLRVGLYRNGLLPQKRLREKVISVGNIAWGGSGKTPFAMWLARRLQQGGLPVSILTRGYRRTSREHVQIIPPGTSPQAAEDAGDEVQLYLRNLRIPDEVPIGVSASRYDAGSLLESRFPVKVHLLDDGFQHIGLHRDLDLVLVDAENPWGRRGAFSSLLRESPAALARADAILLTRCELLPDPPDPNSAEALRNELLRWNPRAPFFAVRTRVVGFRRGDDDHSVSEEEFRLLRPLAFCGIGNPRAFFRTLESSAIPVTDRKIFPDHHRYQEDELAAIEKAAAAHGANCLVTTQKDWVNLREKAGMKLPVYWTEIDLMVEEESRLLHWISERLGLPIADSFEAEAKSAHDRLISESKPGRL